MILQFVLGLLAPFVPLTIIISYFRVREHFQTNRDVKRICADIDARRNGWENVPRDLPAPPPVRLPGGRLRFPDGRIV